MSGQISYLAGISAEDQVARAYADHGHVVLSRRWRGKGGEIDLVLQKGSEVVFVEVKKSRSHAKAAQALSRRQLTRIFRSAEDYLGHLPEGANTPCRVDVALLDDMGRIDVVPNVLCA
jgi:putative endonuclease